jgi:hypothetical protein
MSKIIKSTAIFIAIISCKIGDAQPEQLGYHPIKTDLSGKIIAWNHSDPGKAYTDGKLWLTEVYFVFNG